MRKEKRRNMKKQASRQTKLYTTCLGLGGRHLWDRLQITVVATPECSNSLDIKMMIYNIIDIIMPVNGTP